MNSLAAIWYFICVLLTGGLTGFMALYAWRQHHLRGVLAYAGLALSECLLALTDLISMLSGSREQALFWFNLRFIFLALHPILWLAFALAYAGHSSRLSKILLGGGLVISIITQGMLLTNGLHGLWMIKEVVFHVNGTLWIVDPNVRTPGIWFMVHSFVSFTLLLIGCGFVLATGWRKPDALRGQALLLSAGLLVGVVGSLIPTYKIFALAEFNPIIPGIGIGMLLHALAIFRFQFLKRFPSSQASSVGLT